MKTKQLEKTMMMIVAGLMIGQCTVYAQISNLPTQTSVSDSGTGVGNGDDSVRQAYIQRIKQELMSSMSQAQGTYGRYVSWCNSITATLNRELIRANRQMQGNHMQAAENILTDALIASSQSLAVDPDLGGPMTKTLIDRALVYANSFPITDPLGQLTKLNFLQGSFRFIISTSNEFDPAYYLRYRYQAQNCGFNGCGPAFDLNQFERKLVALASEQVSFLANTFTEPCAFNASYQFCPVGDPTAFLKISELATQFIANDLKNNLHGATQACNIRDLESLSSSLVGFNQLGDRTVFVNSADAVDEAAREIINIAARINAGNSTCRGF